MASLYHGWPSAELRSPGQGLSIRVQSRAHPSSKRTLHRGHTLVLRTAMPPDISRSSTTAPPRGDTSDIAFDKISTFGIVAVIPAADTLHERFLAKPRTGALPGHVSLRSPALDSHGSWSRDRRPHRERCGHIRWWSKPSSACPSRAWGSPSYRRMRRYCGGAGNYRGQIFHYVPPGDLPHQLIGARIADHHRGHHGVIQQFELTTGTALIEKI